VRKAEVRMEGFEPPLTGL